MSSATPDCDMAVICTCLSIGKREYKINQFKDYRREVKSGCEPTKVGWVEVGVSPGSEHQKSAQNSKPDYSATRPAVEIIAMRKFVLR
jgi:hypothetical protein